MLSPSEVKKLTEFLAEPRRPEETFTFHELQGFLFAVVCSPEMVPPPSWLPIISDEQDIGFRDEDEAQEVLGLIMTLHNATNDAVLDRVKAMPPGCSFRKNIEDNFDDALPLSQWSRGFTIGHDWLADVWDDVLPEDFDDEIGSTTMVLSFFASRQLAEAYHLEATTSPTKRKPQRPFPDFAQTMRKLFPDAMLSYAHIGRGMSEIFAELGRSAE